MHMWVKRSAPDIADRVCSYRAGFLPVERRAIEQRLFKGELSGIISTSALELGVDIGGLDVCVLVGYPGTISSTWQRSGRVGRSGGDSLIIMVAGNDALDQYFMRNPQDFFRRPVEAAVLDAENHPIAKEHLKCAAAEFYIKSDDLFYDTRLFAPALKELQDEGYVRYWEKGDTWYSRKRFPHREVSIRGAGVTFLIRDCNGTPIGETSASRVFREQHPGAIYLHKGMQYRVEKLDLGNKEVVCRPADDVEYYTRPISDEETEIISTLATKRLNRMEINYGKLKVTESVLGYRKKHLHTDKLIGEYLLDLPPSVFTTTGIWMGVDTAILDEISGRGFSADGGLHALEHAAIATLPLFALCDRMDLGGVSYPFNPELKGPAIFIYDGHEGGVGLTKRGFSCIGEWLASTLSLMRDCPCEVSCPSCTQDMKCGNNNEPLDKRAAIMILKDWLST
jgi:DEAD/DEAH box helicase domain-containing protein